MARDYGRIKTSFWNSPDIRALSSDGKMLAGYLLTGPHSNSIGAYLLPVAYVCDDLCWPFEAVSKAFAELFASRFCERFKDGRHIVICKFLEHNPIENPNVGKAALKQLALLPDDPALKHVVTGLELYEKQFPNGLEPARERVRNIEPNRTEPYPKPEPEPESAGSACADGPVTDHSLPLPSKKVAKFGIAANAAPCASAEKVEMPAALIREPALLAYNIVALDCGWTEAQRITPKRAAAIKKRLAECGGMEGWEAAMAKARASPFLRGETGRSRGHENWRPDIDFFLRAEVFTKLMEGGFDGRTNGYGQAEVSGFAAVIAGARDAARAAGAQSGSVDVESG